MGFFSDSDSEDSCAPPSKEIGTFDSDSDAEAGEKKKSQIPNKGGGEDEDDDALDSYMSSLAATQAVELGAGGTSGEGGDEGDGAVSGKRKRSERMDLSSDEDEASSTSAKRQQPLTAITTSASSSAQTPTSTSIASAPLPPLHRLITPLALPSAFASLPPSTIPSALRDLNARVTPPSRVLPLGSPPLPSLSSYNLATPYSSPTPIQAVLTPLLLAGLSTLAIAPTGSGKTLSYAVPLLTHLASGTNLSALVIAPTRELVKQIYTVITGQTRKVRSGEERRDELRELTTTLTAYASAVNTHVLLICDSFRSLIYGIRSSQPVLCLYGGLKEENSKWSVQRRLKSQTYPCCVGTPSRVLDFVKSKIVDLARVSFFVMDEYDQLTGKGFLNDVKAIASMVPRQAVRCGVSATEGRFDFSSWEHKVIVGRNEEVKVEEVRGSERRSTELLLHASVLSSSR